MDVVLYGEDGLWAIQITHADKVRPDDLRALKAFTADYPEARPLLLYRGKERLKREGILCMPVGEFLLGLRPEHGIEVD